MDISLFQSKSLLYVEDDLLSRDYMFFILEKLFKKVYLGDDGLDGLEKFRLYRPDLILSDIEMPNMSGLEMAKEIKSISYNTPVVIVSAYYDTNFLSKSIEVGVDGYISKPVNKNMLIETLSKVLKNLDRDREFKKIKETLENITDSMGDGLITLDRENRVTFANPKAKELLGYNDKEIMNLDISTVCDIELLKQLPIGEEFFNRADGESLNVSYTLSTLHKEDASDGIVLIFKDITQIKHIQELEWRAHKQELELLRYKEKYHSKQQENAFEKQLKIIRDELSHIKKGKFHFESYYKPLEVLGGDTYGIIDLDDDLSLVYIVDAMGKGLSASVTSIQSSSFINHMIDSVESCNFYQLVNDYMNFIKKRLLDSEIVCIAFMLIDSELNKLKVANFGMPPILIKLNTQEIDEIWANNPPIMHYLKDSKVSEYDLSKIEKILIYSDGLNEAIIKSDAIFDKLIKSAFQKSFSKKFFLEQFNSNILKSEDDVTLVLISKFSCESIESGNFEIESTFQEVDRVLDLIGEWLEQNQVETLESENLKIVLNELLINALEHGNLEIDAKQKHSLIKSGKYEDVLESKLSLSKFRERKILIDTYIKRIKSKTMIKVDIKDEGSGFDVSETFKYLSFTKELKYNGRGLIMSDTLTDAIFFNRVGNEVTIFKIIDSN